MPYEYTYGNAAYTDTNTEGSDSELSDVAPLDSDVERERQKSYERPLYKEEVAQLRRDASKQYAVRKPGAKTAARPSPASSAQTRARATPSATASASASTASAASAASASQKKKEAPQESLVLEWVFGYAELAFRIAPMPLAYVVLLPVYITDSTCYLLVRLMH